MRFSYMDVLAWPEGRAQKDVFAEAMEQFVACEALGFDAAWVAEHHFSRYGVLGSGFWSFLGALAARTKTLRIGTAVILLPFDHPLHVAEKVAALDIIAEGRLNVGVGRGYQWNEFRVLQVNMDESRQRFQESLEILLQAWTGDNFSYSGPFHQLEHVQVVPAPVQRPHPPIWIAGVSPDTLTWIAEHGFYRMSGGSKTFSQMARDHALYKESLAGMGKAVPPEDVLQRLVYVTEDPPHRVREILEPAIERFFRLQQEAVKPPDWNMLPDQYEYYRRQMAKTTDKVTYEFFIEKMAIVGPPEYVVDRIGWMQENVDLTNFMCWMNFGAIGHRQVMKSLELFAQRVMPHFR